MNILRPSRAKSGELGKGKRDTMDQTWEEMGVPSLRHFMRGHSKRKCKNVAADRCVSRLTSIHLYLHLRCWRLLDRRLGGSLSHKKSQFRQLEHLRAKRRSLFYFQAGPAILYQASETTQRGQRALALWGFARGNSKFGNRSRAPNEPVDCANSVHQEISQHRRMSDSRQACGDRRPARIARSPYRRFEDAVPQFQYRRQRHSFACWPERQSQHARQFPTESTRQLNCEIPAAVPQLDSSEKAARTRGPQSSTRIDTGLAHICRSFRSLSTTSAESKPRTIASENRTAIS
jgi:hypothetical protein